MHLIKTWFHRMLSSHDPIPCDGVWSSQCDRKIPGQNDRVPGRKIWEKPLKALHIGLSELFMGFINWGLSNPNSPSSYAMASQSTTATGYIQLEPLPDYYLNCDSAKRLWQDWRVLRRLFIRHDHSRDLLLQGESGWLTIHGMNVQRQLLTITTDEGETVLNLDEPVVWLSRANPANTQITRQPLPRFCVGTYGLWALA